MFRVRTHKQHIEFWFVGKANGTARVESREILEAKWFAPAQIPPEMSQNERRLIEHAMRIGENQQM